MLKITNWDGTEYTLDQLIEIADEAKESEITFSEALDGDGCTSAHIIKQLASLLKKN